jgi:hypothetical protein
MVWSVGRLCILRGFLAMKHPSIYHPPQGGDRQAEARTERRELVDCNCLHPIKTLPNGYRPLSEKSMPNSIAVVIENQFSSSAGDDDKPSRAKNPLYPVALAS